MPIKDPAEEGIKTYKNHKNPNWKKRWKTIVKYDNDWDWEFFFDIIMHKLYLMLDRYTEKPSKVLLADEEVRKIADSLQGLIKLGERIRDDNYDDEPYLFLVKHTKDITEKGGGRSLEWDSEENHEEFRKMQEKCYKERQSDINAFFQKIANEMETWWD